MVTATQKTIQPSAEECWRAVAKRDSKFDGAFVFAVSTTGIYCRPSCPSRRPSRENVTFYREPSEAEKAGYRACLRCRPMGPEIPEEQTRMVEAACRFISDRAEPPTLEEIGRHLSVSPYYLQRTFKRVIGITPRQYAGACRAARLKEGLREGESVTNALYDAGFGSSSRLYEQSPAYLGMTPRAYKRGGAGMNIRYTVADCKLGKLLVGATERGICAVQLGATEGELQAGLEREYPSAGIRRDNSQVRAWTEAILRYLDGEQTNLDMPTDLQATAFQQRVWEELRRIPYGSTRTYGEVAARIGEPKASRAVAQACASNHVALVVPCHRVVRGDGEIGGYRWGADRKRSLLNLESARGGHTQTGDEKTG